MKVKLPCEIRDAFPARPVDAYKRSVGVVAVVGGSAKFPHAPVISALGARSAGAGLVQLVAPDTSRAAAGALVPEATMSKLGPTCVPPSADVCVVGMGLGVSASSEALVTRLLSGAKGRFVVDADALTILASWYGKRGGCQPSAGLELVFTPHEGEAARLLGCDFAGVHADREAAAREIASRYCATVVLKGPETLVVSHDVVHVFRNTTGNPFMALGGMGDLLSGVIGARWAYLKGDPFVAASSAAWLHGAASDALVAECGDPSVSGTAARIGSLRVALESGLAAHVA